SLFILLSSDRFRRLLTTVRYVIVDEVHAVAGNKRGVHLSLTLERLEHLARRAPVRIGLSATQHPIEEVARFLVGQAWARAGSLEPRACRIVDVGRRRDLDLEVIAPAQDLGAVATNAVWNATYDRLAALIQAHRTTLVFANSRRLAERIAVRLTERLGQGVVAAHHGSLSRRQRLEAERRLKAGEIKAIVATGSLELGIDIGTIDLVCQVESPRAVATAVQRFGRSGHWLGATPKGRLFALTRDDVLEGAAVVRAIREGLLDRTEIPQGCLDVLAQQLVAAAAAEEWEAGALYRLVRRSWCYRDLPARDFEAVLAMLSERLPTEPRGVAPRLHWDRLQRRVRARRGARLAAVTSGGTIPDTTNYDVYLEPQGVKLGQVEEDFAQESMVGDIFTLGNASWRITGVRRGRMSVESAAGLPPTIPFWHGEVPGRTFDLSREVARLRQDLAARLVDLDRARAWLGEVAGLDLCAAAVAVEYLARQQAAVGVIPTDRRLLVERFFDSLGGTQVVLHAAFGMRVNRAWGLALSKRICRSFNFEIQSAATDDAILLSLGPRHSFPLEALLQFLSPESVEEVLVQAVLAAPLFETRFRQCAVRALMILRHAGGKKVPAYLQRLRATDLLAACFPAQQACADNRSADIPVSDHPLVRETLRECLEEALDLVRLRAVLTGLREGSIEAVTREVPVPSPFAHKILAAWDYAFLDDAPREERRSRTVQAHRGLVAEVLGSQALEGLLDPGAVAQVGAEVGRTDRGRQARDADELVELLKEHGPLAEGELAARVAGDLTGMLETLRGEGRAVLATRRAAGPPVWMATEILPLCRAAYPDLTLAWPVTLPASLEAESWAPAAAQQELVRRLFRHSGPLTAEQAARRLDLAPSDVARALAALEAEGLLFQGRYVAGEPAPQWCERTILERIHRQTLTRLRREIEPVALPEFAEFLLHWQHLVPEGRLHGLDGLLAVAGQLQGLELPAVAWERDILPMRLADYRPELLDQACLSGAVAWGRLRASAGPTAEDPAASPGKAPPRATGTSLALFLRPDLGWARASASGAVSEVVRGLSGEARASYEVLSHRGACFTDDLAAAVGVEPPAALLALWELVRAGLVTNDSFTPVRFLLALEGRLALLHGRDQGQSSRQSLRFRARLRSALQGRWSLLPQGPEGDTEERTEAWAYLLLERYGVVFRELAGLEAAAPAWRELVWTYRRLEYSGRLRRGLFVEGVSGEQYALPGAVELLRARRRAGPSSGWLVLATMDPGNLYGAVVPGPKIARLSGNLLVLRGGRPVLALEGTRAIAPGLTLEEVRQAVAMLAAERRGRRLTVESWNESPVLQSPVASLLAEAGFHSDGLRLVHDGLPGPRPATVPRHLRPAG
ncbi:MAG: hypothetical protein HYY85_11465, partial [Deltaproteobacteria bacterium]|nr:hypothetical protein [Deltaproteobacteria bacterium]